MLSVKTTTAAILVESGSPLIIDEITLPSELGAGQVLVEVITSGICGAQINEIDAVKGPDKFLPHLLGHEGFARVLEIGPGVTTVLPDDFVIMHWRPGSGIQAKPALYEWQGKRLNAGWVTTFNNHGVVSENRVTKILPGAHKKNLLPLLGCALTTALGVLENDAKVNFRDSILVFGSGGVGLALIKVAKIFGVNSVVMVDISDEKLKYATDLGASKTVKFTNKEETLNHLRTIYGKVLPSVAIDTTGNTDAIELCYEVSSNLGRVILVGVPKADSRAKIYTLPLHFDKILKGSQGGDSKPEIDIPILLDLMSRGDLNFDNYPTQAFKLNGINGAIENLRNGASGRMVIDFATL
jgi:S-(hydroxymethyl)glutathione dehydrogenase / alcohol dehydrogenase